MKINHNNFLKLAFENAKVNLGKTRMNPSVGCIIVKNDSVISSGRTSIFGRPHAEVNAFNSKKNFKNADLYVFLTTHPTQNKNRTYTYLLRLIRPNIKKNEDLYVFLATHPTQYLRNEDLYVFLSRPQKKSD